MKEAVAVGLTLTHQLQQQGGRQPRPRGVAWPGTPCYNHRARVRLCDDADEVVLLVGKREIVITSQCRVGRDDYHLYHVMHILKKGGSRSEKLAQQCDIIRICLCTLFETR